MTTPTAPAPSSLTSPAQRVGQLVRETVTELQRDYLADRPAAVAALARLRRGAGKTFGEVPEDLWGLIDTGPLHTTPPGARPLHETELTWAEDAVHTALTLWALHQQSRGSGMHICDTRTAPRGLGAAARRLMSPGDIDEPVRKRLVRAGSAPSLPALASRLRDIVLLLRRDDIALDYALLAEQLYQWQQPGGRDAVRRAWARSFHAYRRRDDEQPADQAGTSVNADTTTTTDKDAS
ncbi:type I-E CRISPR-associated protein Cse2/CasB [Streptomyces lavendulocolor]|uniref:type I-E CRISPR-associated protein Cse2/CasB n=1 Tax=Streptomyces lavendulocolor TaxID=67316 RepID=UPI0033F18141